MSENRFRPAYVLSILTIVLGVAASMGGLLIKGLYQDNALVTLTWFGNDLVTLLLVIPIMVGALVLVTRGSQKAQLVWIGALWYMSYNYLFYLYGSRFNSFFLLYVALFTIPAYALIFAMANMDVAAISKCFRPRTPVRAISVFMLLFALFLGAAWIALSLRFVMTGELPPHIAQTDGTTSVVFAADLSFALPLMIWSAILLWRRKPWGYVLATMVMFKAVTYGLVLTVNSYLGYYKLGTADELTWVWIVLTLGGLACWGSLLHSMKAPGAGKSAPIATGTSLRGQK